MNTVPRHVIVDLLPLYLANEVSAETHQLVEAYLREDPLLFRRVEELSRGADAAPGATPVALSSELELTSLRRTHRRLAQQRWSFGLALAFTSVGLSVGLSTRDGHVADVHLMLRDYPATLGLCLVMAAAFWATYAWTRRR